MKCFDFFKNFENLEKIYLFFFFLFLNYEMHKWKDIELVQRKDWNLVQELKDDFKLLVEEEFIRFLV